MSEQNVITSLLDDLTQAQSIRTAICIGQNMTQYNVNKKIQWQHFNVIEVLNLPFTQRYDLSFVVFNDEVERLSLSEQTHLIVKLRDLWAKHVVVMCSSRYTNLMRELGFSQMLREQGEGDSPILELWQFNILDYKSTPDWLNSKFWANPENWNKFRW
ncbi:DUF6231 family protein [Acinetobacter pollinis]|uniref:Uncharacterized protein n=1 Tax=Acinetobacter pollinis TaxID=2605270 RepID=A0ABU6DPW4_9GAMM|nr:DUF6231 family protein [Acinetobacter pollinis]MBF7690487.1 hypothetical protein [Acinetobacter pollinis]MBF7692517.1 hypothetical protein [Acinetobacter pollinis]MBF7697508.1 hypothetical protein [Acinetobacter pollinis]MBF7699667.1 hypothetical protein [Acinetobacter pollinis]MEB5475904.1 hypothetical protein [Acinetobacter pollinis]